MAAAIPIPSRPVPSVVMGQSTSLVAPRAVPTGEVAWNTWIQDNIPTTMPWGPIWIYANAVSGVRWHGLRNPYSVGVLLLPFVAGYVAHRKTNWGPRWSVLAGFGVLYVFGSIQAIIGSAFRGGGY